MADEPLYRLDVRREISVILSECELAHALPDEYHLAESKFREAWLQLRQRPAGNAVQIVLRTAFVLALLVAPAGAQWHLDATFDQGKAYNYLEGAWVNASTPGVEALFGPWSLGASVSTNRGRVFERSLYGSYGLEFGRLSVSAGGSFYKYPGAGFDWTWSTGVRFRLR